MRSWEPVIGDEGLLILLCILCLAPGCFFPDARAVGSSPPLPSSPFSCVSGLSLCSLASHLALVTPIASMFANLIFTQFQYNHITALS